MKKNFTILELLLVIAVIVILMSVLLPALAKSREHAKRISCAGNQKQLGNAFMFYVDDYDGLFPPYDYTYRIYSYVTDSPPSPNSRTKQSVFLCPSTKVSDQTWLNEVDYAMDADLRTAKLSKIQKPSEQPALVDAGGSCLISSGLWSGNGGLRMRHGGGANWLFADIHVAWSKKNYYLP